MYHIRDSVFTPTGDLIINKVNANETDVKEITWKRHVFSRVPTLQCILLSKNNLAFRKHQKVFYYSTDGHALSFND